MNDHFIIGTNLPRTLLTVAAATIIIFLFSTGCDRIQESAQTTPTEQQRDRLTIDSNADSLQYADLVDDLKPMTTASQPYRLAVIMKYFGNPYYQNLAEGMYARAEESGVLIDFQAGISESDQEGQRAVLEKAINRNYDAILVSPQADTNLAAAAKMASARGILLINVGGALLGESDYYIGPDQNKSGALAAEYFLDNITQGGKLAVIQGHVGDYGVEQQTNGFTGSLTGSSWQIVATPFCVWDLQIALQAAKTILSKFPDLKGFYCHNDTMALGVIQAVRQAGKTGKVMIIGRDGTELALRAIKNGELTATIDTHAFDTGKIAVDLTVRILDGLKVPRVIFTPQKLIEKQATL